MQHTILVTGAGGYIGSIATKLLLENNYKVIAVDNFKKGYKEPLEKLQLNYGSEQLVIEEADITDKNISHLFTQYTIDAVMHFAALLNVGESSKMPESYFTNNVWGTQNILEQTIKHNVAYFIFSGSCTVYGNAQYLPIDEKHPIQKPESVYGQSKRMCEELLDWYSKLGRITYVTLRYFNVCGATLDGEYGDSKKPSFHLMQNCIRGAMGIEPFNANYATVNTPDGSPIRDYVHVVDLAQAHVNALQFLLKEKRSEVFNIGTGSGYSVLQIIDKVKEITGANFPVNPASERRVGEADTMVADFTKAKNILGWKPTFSLEDSVKSLVHWYTKYPNGWSR
jgi:UDP-glucose 4-epimerase